MTGTGLPDLPEGNTGLTVSGSLFSALDVVLGRAKDLLLDFDGVVARLYQPDARVRTADWPRARLADPATGYHRPAPRSTAGFT